MFHSSNQNFFWYWVDCLSLNTNKCSFWKLNYRFWWCNSVFTITPSRYLSLHTFWIVNAIEQIRTRQTAHLDDFVCNIWIFSENVAKSWPRQNTESLLFSSLEQLMKTIYQQIIRFGFKATIAEVNSFPLTFFEKTFFCTWFYDTFELNTLIYICLLQIGETVEVKHPDTGRVMEAIIKQMIDSSMYTVGMWMTFILNKTFTHCFSQPFKIFTWILDQPCRVAKRYKSV